MNVVACKLYVIQYTAMKAHAYHAYSESLPGIPIAILFGIDPCSKHVNPSDDCSVIILQRGA